MIEHPSHRILLTGATPQALDAATEDLLQAGWCVFERITDDEGTSVMLVSQPRPRRSRPLAAPTLPTQVGVALLIIVLMLLAGALLRGGAFPFLALTQHSCHQGQ